MNDKKPQLIEGSEWLEYKNYIVGDEAGIRNLKQACDYALQNGEFRGEGLGNYVGIKKLDSEWFEDPMDASQLRKASFRLTFYLILLSILALIGFGTVIFWFL